MMASYRVVMGDGPAVRNHRVERRALDGAPLCAELARLAKRVEREIAGGAVRIDMREAAGDLPLAAGRLVDRGFGRGLNRVVEFSEALPRDCGLERVVDHAAQDQPFHGVGHADEGIAPHTGRAFAVRLSAGRLGRAAVISTAFTRPLHPRSDIVVGRLEGQHHDGDRAIRRARVVGLGRIEDAAVRGIEAGLRDCAHGVCCGREILEAHRATIAECRPVLQAHPRLGDDAENSFRADHDAVRARPRAGARQTAAFNHAPRRNGAQRFDEIVDVGIERGEVAAGARRNPAPERRIFEALREVAQREPMWAKLCFERGAVGAGLDQRGARSLVDLLDLSHLAQVDRDRAPVPIARGPCR